MKLSENYVNLTDSIVYNQLYALKYPAEDRTNLEKEYKEITELLSELKAYLKSDYKLQQLEFAAKEIEDAFAMFREGKDGYKKMENALEYIDRSKKKAPPKTNFISGKKGVIEL